MSTFTKYGHVFCVRLMCATLATLLQNFGKEILADEKSEVKYEKVLSILEKASGAAYGTGK